MNASAFSLPPIGEIRFCGCWIVNLPQGLAVLPCKQHEVGVMRALDSPMRTCTCDMYPLAICEVHQQFRSTEKP